MKYPNNALLFISLFLLLIQQLAQSAATEAASVLAAFAEHEIVTSDLHLSYEDAAGLADSFLYHYSIGAEPELFPDAYASWDVSFAPYSSTIATDAIDAQLSLGLEYGQPVTGATYTNDTFVVDLSGQIAAQAALNRRGNPADGKVNGTVKGEFDLEPGYGGAVHGDVVGMLVVPQYNLDTGLTYLDFSFGQTYTDGTDVMYTEVLYPSPFPFGEMQFELLAGEAYMFKIEYEAYVPYGSVGSHSADFLIPIIPQGDFYGVPEPGTLALLAIGLLCLVHPRIRRARRPLPLGHSAGNGCSPTSLNPCPTHKNPLTKIPKKTWLLIALFAILIHPLACSTPAKAASVLDAFAPANTSLTTKIHMQYTDFTGYTDEDSLTFYYHVDPENGPNAYAFWDESLPPASSSNPNDGIDAQISLGLEFGHPVSGSTTTNDTFVFDASGQINVQDARTTRGHPADGKIIGSVKAEFALEPGFGGAVQGDVVGMLIVPETNLAPGLTYLGFSFGETTTYGNSAIYTETLYYTPFGELQFELLAGEDYLFQIVYEAYVPYGSVGSHSTAFEIPIIPQGDFYGVPEPAALLLVLLGLALLPRRRRQRSWANRLN